MTARCWLAPREAVSGGPTGRSTTRLTGNRQATASRRMRSDRSSTTRRMQEDAPFTWAPARPNGSSDSEAGVGLYRSTDGGNSWSLVPGSLAVARDRSIAAIAVDPLNARHLFIGNRRRQAWIIVCERRALHAAGRRRSRRIRVDRRRRHLRAGVQQDRGSRGSDIADRRRLLPRRREQA